MPEGRKISQEELLGVLHSKDHENKDARVLWEELNRKIFKDIRRKLEKYKRQLGEDLDELALDLTQETCVRILKSIDSFEERSNVTTWIFRIVNNLIIDRVRAKKELLHVSDEGQRFGEDTLTTSIQGMGDFNVEELLSVKRAIEKLAPADQALFMARLKGDSFDEVAAELGVRQGTVFSRSDRIKNDLRKKLED